jgi:alkylhydroperoxidase/carboxymuconolactone decarboxylase family protein YurZ
VQGEVPAYVPFLATHYPLALKAFRARYETSMDGALPKQFIALCQLHLAACWRQPDAVRRTLHMSKHFGVTKNQAVQILTLAMLYLGDVAIDAALADVTDIIDAWE